MVSYICMCDNDDANFVCDIFKCDNDDDIFVSSYSFFRVRMCRFRKTSNRKQIWMKNLYKLLPKYQLAGVRNHNNKKLSWKNQEILIIQT